MAFNPRWWGTAFARNNGHEKREAIRILSILVDEELLLQVMIQLKLGFMNLPNFQSSLMRNCFCKYIPETDSIESVLYNFQSSLMRNCFCKHKKTHIGGILANLSILVDEELLLQEKTNSVTIDVYYLSFQSSLMRNCYCKVESWGEGIRKGWSFQSSLMRNCYCKQYLLMGYILQFRYSFQSSLMRNCYCKYTLSQFESIQDRILSILVDEELLLQEIVRETLVAMSKFPFNPRWWGTAIARVIFYCLFFVLKAYKGFFSGGSLEHG